MNLSEDGDNNFEEYAHYDTLQPDSLFITGDQRVKRVPTPAHSHSTQSRIPQLDDSPTTREACKSLGLKFQDLEYKTLEQLKQKLTQHGQELDTKDLLSQWEDFEKERRNTYASVMIMRDKLKQAQFATSDKRTNMSIEKSMQPIVNKVRTPQSSASSRFNFSSHTGQQGKFPKGAKELLEIEKIRLQQIMEDEKEYLKQAIQKEAHSLDQKEQNHFNLFQEREEFRKAKEQKNQEILREKERVRLKRLKEQEDLLQQQKQKNDEYLQQKRQEELQILEVRKRNEEQLLQKYVQNDKTRQKSSERTVARKQQIFEDHMRSIEEKKLQLYEKESTKSELLAYKQYERRAKSNIRQKDIDHKIYKVLSKSELLEQERKRKLQTKVIEKEDKIETIRSNIKKEKNDHRESMSSYNKQRINQAQRQALEAELKKVEQTSKKIEDQEMKVSDIIKKLKQDQSEQMQKKHEKQQYRENYVEQVLQEQEQQRSEIKQNNSQSDQEYNNIMMQRERIRDQIKNIKKKFQLERENFIDGLRSTNSRENRSRILVKLNKRNEYSSDQHTSPSNHSFIGSNHNYVYNRKPSLNSSLFNQ